MTGMRISAWRALRINSPLLQARHVPRSNVRPVSPYGWRSHSTTTDICQPLELSVDRVDHDTQFKEARLQQLSLPKYPRFQTHDPATELPWTSVQSIRKQWDDILVAGEQRHEARVRIAGRIVGKREASSKLIFCTIMENDTCLQVVISHRRMASPTSPHTAAADQPPSPSATQIVPPAAFKDHHRLFHRGDIVQITGIVGKTKTGELSVYADGPLQLLAPCLHDLPVKSGLKNPERRYRQRYFDFLINAHQRQAVFVTRARIIQFLRTFFNDRQFLEVETPILWPRSGGANARPFLIANQPLPAHSVAGSAQPQPSVPNPISATETASSLQLRIAPELFLKQLVVGGFDRVYEIGKQFRNEGVDMDHNPEFTTLEFYQAYTNLEGLMSLTENLFTELLTHLHSTLPQRPLATVTPASNVDPLTMTYTLGNGSDLELSFQPPFRRIHVSTELTRQLSQPLPDFTDTDAATQTLLAMCHARDIPVTQPYTLTRVLDTLISRFIEPQCVQPTFLYGHPKVMSPLAKASEADRSIAQRFELFVAGKEIVNAYEELNDPAEQRERFAQQLKVWSLLF
ncbi:hypothetical protein H4R35_004247 [Dimargaris xerosporica]|nr:hypothetical protein H4R35_004247 [Dimargaris xerosporica]